ncbi:DUF3800 domain-containing protein [Chryseobacterium sp. FH1]|uniref:DUF3800 domain-containing protein n=1 Tax=Chryseobacterium sp. FH1 TaxID=1233951 RepID=UPI0004E43FC4|nr:DUF3800 domain-containing protein [Chryseobacterium sp. FH1]KFC20417.1 hypothetical protein IO90_14765 [Chryseobacterium sp. FH1]
MTQQITAFADEFGNNSFNFQTQGSHFIVATVITKTDNIENLKNQVKDLRQKHKFQTGELKSSKVAKDYLRRKRILEDIAKLDISIYAVIIDKQKLTGEGFNFKKSFYKFTNNLLYKELFRTFPTLDLYVDEHGGNEFLKEFKKYVERNHSRNLFSGADFNIQDSKQNELIQLADFVAGSLGYIFDELKKSEHSNEFQNILTPKISSLTHFPPINWTYEEFHKSNIDESFDSRIAEVCITRIQDFLDKETGSDQQKIDQINFLKLLLWLQRAYPKNRYTTTAEILGHLNQNRPTRIQDEYFRSKVVGSLRDKGILIASGRQGYKIPTTAKDLDNFVNHGKRIILPMLNRINEARQAIKLATMNDLDLLEHPEYDELKHLIDNK